MYVMEGYAGVAGVYLTLCEQEGASERDREAAGRACAALRRYARVFPIAAPRSWLCRGRLDWVDGRRRRAQRAWQASLAEAARLGMPYEEALAHYALGRHVAHGNAARSAHLRRACEMFAQLGSDYDLSQARAALERAPG
jgi:hypothetical protein